MADAGSIAKTTARRDEAGVEIAPNSTHREPPAPARPDPARRTRRTASTDPYLLAMLRPPVADRYLMLPSQYIAQLGEAQSKLHRLGATSGRSEFEAASRLLDDELRLLAAVGAFRGPASRR
ncbi:MAG: hypothetical protein ACFCUJ_06985 [Thiotrichales bacterium]